jgi:hypothetical protein
MPSYTSKKLAFNNAEQFKESFFEPEPTTIGYVFIANHLSWPNEDSPTVPNDTVSDEKVVWDNMFAAKKITGNDVELVVPKITWSSNTKFKQFDDTIELSELLSSNTITNTYPMYVINSQNDVYKCLCNNVSQASSVEPTGKNLSANGNIATSDGYLWKYLFNVRPSNRFLTEDWMPVPTSTNKLDYDASNLTPVDGELVKIITTNGGSNYIHSNVFVFPYTTGCTVLELSNTINVSENMAVTGLGIPGGTFIQSIDTLNTKITVSNPTTSNGGGSGNLISLSTRVEIDGDGFGAVASVQLTNTAISKIVVNSYGKDYTKANINIYGTGTAATARAVLPTKFGHGFNAAKELGASNVMIVMRIGEVDSTENGVISTQTSFRQYGLLRDPYKYGLQTPVNTATSNSVISQTTNVTLIAGANYNLEEFVYQGSSANNATFSGFIHAQTANEVRLTRVEGAISIGTPLRGTTTNPTGRVVVNLINPQFEPYTGDILYLDNITKIERTDGQAENLKFVVRF